MSIHIQAVEDFVKKNPEQNCQSMFEKIKTQMVHI